MSEESSQSLELTEQRIEQAIKRIMSLVQSGYLPRALIDDLQVLVNAATAWEMMSKLPKTRERLEKGSKDG